MVCSSGIGKGRWLASEFRLKTRCIDNRVPSVFSASPAGATLWRSWLGGEGGESSIMLFCILSAATGQAAANLLQLASAAAAYTGTIITLQGSKIAPTPRSKACCQPLLCPTLHHAKGHCQRRRPGHIPISIFRRPLAQAIDKVHAAAFLATQVNFDRLATTSTAGAAAPAAAKNGHKHSPGGSQTLGRVDVASATVINCTPHSQPDKQGANQGRKCDNEALLPQHLHPASAAVRPPQLC